MIWNDYSFLEGKHAILSASNPAWLNYDADKLIKNYLASQAAKRGTEEHELAKRLIDLGIRLPEEPVTTLGLYVNDAIGFRMRAEQKMFVTEWAFGTADAIIFRQNILRVHDLKTGLNEAGFTQLRVYAAFFCMEHVKNPFQMESIELRIYQNNEIKVEYADPDAIVQIIETIKHHDKILKELKREEAS